MRQRSLAVLGMALVCVLICRGASAQEASLTGVATDDTKSVLPGVTVTATGLANGAQFVSVTDVRGEYRLLQLPPGHYRINADLTGFGSVVLPDIQLLVGQNAVVPLRAQARASQRDGDGHGRGAAGGHRPRRRWRATSTPGRWKNCRSRAATGWSCRRW